MKIEAGKYYKTRDGSKVGPMVEKKSYGNGELYFACKRTGLCYQNGNNGMHGTSAVKRNEDDDLVSEWVDEPTQETGTLAELDVKPGDVVKWNGSDSPYTAQEMPNPNDKRKLWAKNDWGWIGDDARCRIISRATQPDKPKTWGEMTDAEKGALLLAYHEGKEIELQRSDGEWISCASPNWAAVVPYRTKPQPVFETVSLVWDILGSMGASVNYGNVKNHRLTFTTRDGEPATGRFVNEAGDVITLERIGGDA